MKSKNKATLFIIIWMYIVDECLGEKKVGMVWRREKEEKCVVEMKLVDWSDR